jgi:tellurium resistance protein TerD
MTINLQKGGDVSLTREAPGLKSVIVGLGWDPHAAEGAGVDLDGSAFLLGADGKVRGDADFIFYNNLVSADGSVEHSGDQRSGVAAGDDERLLIDLERVPPDVERIAVAVTIHEGGQRHRDFGMVGHAFIRCLDGADEHEIARYDLTDEASSDDALVFGELYRSGADWKFRAVGQGHHGGLGPLARSFGVDA